MSSGPDKKPGGTRPKRRLKGLALPPRYHRVTSGLSRALIDAAAAGRTGLMSHFDTLMPVPAVQSVILK
jgi:hypothetical protein